MDKIAAGPEARGAVDLDHRLADRGEQGARLVAGPDQGKGLQLVDGHAAGIGSKSVAPEGALGAADVLRQPR